MRLATFWGCGTNGGLFTMRFVCLVMGWMGADEEDGEREVKML